MQRAFCVNATDLSGLGMGISPWRAREPPLWDATRSRDAVEEDILHVQLLAGFLGRICSSSFVRVCLRVSFPAQGPNLFQLVGILFLKPVGRTMREMGGKCYLSAVRLSIRAPTSPSSPAKHGTAFLQTFPIPHACIPRTWEFSTPKTLGYKATA